MATVAADLKKLGLSVFNIVYGQSLWIVEDDVGGQIPARGELYDVFNNPKFDAPNGNVAATTFGQITGASGARQIQLGLRVPF